MLLEKLVLIICLLGSCALQFGADFFVLGNVNPDFLLILTIYFSLHKGELAGLWVGFFAGLLQDINLGGYSLSFDEIKYFIGIHALPNALAGYFSGKFVAHIKKDSNLMVFFALFVLSLGKNIAVLILVIIFHQGINLKVLFSILAPESLYTSVIAIFWFKLLMIIFPLGQESATKVIYNA